MLDLILQKKPPLPAVWILSGHGSDVPYTQLIRKNFDRTMNSWVEIDDKYIGYWFFGKIDQESFDEDIQFAFEEEMSWNNDDENNEDD